MKYVFYNINGFRIRQSSQLSISRPHLGIFNLRVARRAIRQSRVLYNLRGVREGLTAGGR